jgi:hypothetical protein
MWPYLKRKYKSILCWPFCCSYRIEPSLFLIFPNSLWCKDFEGFVSENAFSSCGALVGHCCEICFRFCLADVPLVAGQIGWKRGAQRR